MQLSKFFKGLAIALPVMTLAACSTTEDTTATGTTENTEQVTIVEESVVPTEAEMIAELSQTNTVFFAFDNAEIQPEYANMLAAHAEFLKAYPNVNVTVEGHADERGTPEYNIALGERRAKAVVAYLQSLGVPSAQLSIVSYGEEKPLVLGQNAKAYAQNRRAVIVY
ncbi:Peptidoglycan-associated lipoprotein [Vibrio stylophorae]|uniref:Peptidoglycan-associated lipoprotein n=1 Tax=Vibrio stylophorae TaxID=659351 RepID=A0ABN8DUG4_9VIBR|nr:peptidoglycan-associated lipoprotein Pal [Vibrio stylophorae]CAH0533007.1 Peptidoglycan-associated lipoprotein [Vibrio stylophorae]